MEPEPDACRPYRKRYNVPKFLKKLYIMLHVRPDPTHTDRLSATKTSLTGSQQVPTSKSARSSVLVLRSYSRSTQTLTMARFSDRL